MKFLFFSGHAHLALDPGAGRSSGGAELQVALLARALVGRGREAVILAAGDGVRDGVVWHGVRVRDGGRFDTGGLGDAVRALPRVVKVLREERPDFVVVYGWTAWLYLLCQLQRVFGFRVVFVCALDAEIDGGFRRGNPVRGWLFESGMRAAAVRFGITRHQVELFHGRGMSCALTRLLLQQGLVPAGSVHKAVDLLWVARCHPVKRPMAFLDLAEALPSAACRMICSPQDEALWRAVRGRAAGMANVEFLDGVPYRDIQGHFDEAKVFVNTSDVEGVPNTFLHASLGGAAILTWDVDPDGMLERFGAGFCARRDAAAFIREAGRLLGEPAALARARDGTGRFLREWHDNDRNVDAFLAGLPS